VKVTLIQYRGAFFAPKLTGSKATPPKIQIKGAADGRRWNSAATIELRISAIITT
jgi:hypothetical protein